MIFRNPYKCLGANNNYYITVTIMYCSSCAVTYFSYVTIKKVIIHKICIRVRCKFDVLNASKIFYSPSVVQNNYHDNQYKFQM
uniref:Uncharacterized protein n=1 Tax=Octopus bimaculoides TaxID=37653 RepID=A0A0L8GWB7_OCTBM